MNTRIKQKNLYITEQKAEFVYKIRLRSDIVDRRMKKTKKAIYDALKSLLAKESYSKITVSEIIEEADIGRSTFYAHYETKDDLLKEMCHDIFLHIMDSNLTKEETHNFSGNPLRFRTLITHILYHIKEEDINLKGLLEGENGIYFWQNFRLQSQHFIQTYLLQHHRQNYENRLQSEVIFRCSSSAYNQHHGSGARVITVPVNKRITIPEGQINHPGNSANC